MEAITDIISTFPNAEGEGILSEMIQTLGVLHSTIPFRLNLERAWCSPWLGTC